MVLQQKFILPFFNYQYIILNLLIDEQVLLYYFIFLEF